MVLIAVLLVVVTERYWHPLSSRKVFAPLQNWHGWLAQRLAGQRWFDGAAGVLLTIAPPVLVVGIIQAYLGQPEDIWQWLFSLLYSVLILIFCIGDKRFSTHVRSYLQAVEQGDLEQACHYMNSITHTDTALQNPVQLDRDFVALLLSRLNERVLAVLFWFVVLGPLGAVLYRAISQLAGGTRADTQTGFVVDNLRFKAILDWLPVRLTALCYALIGSFSDAITVWRQVEKASLGMIERHRLLLGHVGLAALQLQNLFQASPEPGQAESQPQEIAMTPELSRQHVHAAQDLGRRTVFAWLTVLAMLTLAGWLV